jgi:O-antigen/teichoic acid export membrane protein
VRARLKYLTTGVAIYGAGDAAISVVNFLLIPIYVRGGYLTTADYGALAVLTSLEAYVKVIGRWGLDGSFMRFYHERAEGEARRTLGSTILWFLLVLNGILLAASLAAGRWITHLVELDPVQVTALRLMLLNTFLLGFTFLPMHSMRLRNEAVAYSAFAFARSVGTVVLRIGLVIGIHLGVAGMYTADLIMTVVLLPLMWPWLRPVAGFRFSVAELRQTLRFGLPRLPHGLASQTLDGNPKLMLERYTTPVLEGIYQNGVTLGTGVAFFKNAFETAFAPFYYKTAREADAKVTFSKMATYGVAVFVLLVAGTIAVARDAILLLLTPSYLEALPVVPLVAVAYGLQGIYQLTTIGLNLTSRTEFYSAATISAAIASLVSGALLIPRYHLVGAGLTVLLAYSTQFAVAFVLAQRLYHVRYEYSRLARLIGAGVLATVGAVWLVPAGAPLIGLLLRGSTTVAIYGGLLWATGFLRSTERAFLREMVLRGRGRSPSPPRPSAAPTDAR